MLHKIRNFLKNFMFVELGVGITNCVVEYFEYQKYGCLTALPLHLRIFISAGLAALSIAVAFIVWLILGYVIKRKR